MRRRNMIVAMAAAIASGLSLAGPAQAFDSGDCNTAFGSGNVIDVDQFSKDTGTSGEIGEIPLAIIVQVIFHIPQELFIVEDINAGEAAVRAGGAEGEIIGRQLPLAIF